jgi:hypothetical protein
MIFLNQGVAWHTGQNSLVHTGIEGRVRILIFLKLEQNEYTDGEFWSSGDRAFQASGILCRGNLLRWSVLAN